ncbi:MAG: GGDEF domain-containing protein [Gammaproteobacteria bacterium]|nr:GGDEF domain-containing protein [Gammaproteobacteria bacterium]
MNVSGVIHDAALRERLSLLAAAAGWRCWLCSDRTGLERIIAALAPTPDLLIFDDLADVEQHLEHSAIRVLVTELPAGPSASREYSQVDPDQSDDDLLHALKTCVNARRLRERFAEFERTEPITSLPRHEELFRSLQGSKGRPLGLLVVQIDHAAHLYDSLDPVSKTDLLAAMGAHIRDAVPANGVLGFFDAACFVVALPEIAEDQLSRAAQAVVARVRAPLFFRGGELHLTVSVGHAFDAMYAAPDRLWARAWRAMRAALENGGDRCAGADNASVSNRLPQALEREEFSLVLQPQVAVDGGRIAGAETLLRWQGMEVGELAPNRFIPMAEQRGHMARIGDWVLDRACREAANWLEHLLDPVILGINVSPQQFHKAAIVERIGRYRTESWFDPAMLELELSQDAMLTLVDDYRTQLYQLRDWGVRFAMDNLGSSLIDTAKLLRCPADTLKIDRALISRLDEDREARELVAQICQLGQRFELRVVAVGVERAEQLTLLERFGCTDVQGYLFSPPVSLAQFRALLNEEHRRPAGNHKG